jgi:endonuclease/exonuclease/phosphatase family metal-dependent hydrolase
LHVPVHWNGSVLHAVVAHLGLMHGGRVRQVERIAAFIEAEVPKHELLILAGDFNDWGNKLDAAICACGLTRAAVAGAAAARVNTFPSRIPVFSLDRIYTRGLRCLSTSVPRGNAWARMSDHLPLVAELALE